MAKKPTVEDFEKLKSAINNLTGKINTQTTVLNNGPTSDDFQSLSAALHRILNTKESSDSEEATEKNTEKIKENSEETKKNTDSKKSLISKLGDFGKNLEKFTSVLNKTQKDFGVSIAGAGKLQVSAITASIKSFIDSFKSINFSQIFAGVKNIAGITLESLFDAGKNALDFTAPTGSAKNALMAGIDKIGVEFTKTLAGPAPTLGVLPEEILEATKFYQEEFGIINEQFGEDIAREAKNRGLSAQQLVQARRVFATTALGDLNKVAGIQSRFFDQFAAKGLTPKIALEAISKYSELIARNGIRFSDSFARAAADAKKIGVDLGKVDQIGDNIIDNFESFLEGSAEMGAMGFDFDTTRLLRVAETGSTADLFNELRSQLARTGKDITQLRRSQRLGLENFLGINISDMLKMMGMTPGGETGKLDPAEQTNNLLANLLVLLAVSGPVIGLLSSLLTGIKTLLSVGGPIAGPLGKLLFSPAGALVITTALVGAAAYSMGASIDKRAAELTQEGKDLIAQGKIPEGTKKIQEARGMIRNAVRAGEAGPMDDFVRGSSTMLRALDEADAIVKEEVWKYNKNKIMQSIKDTRARQAWSRYIREEVLKDTTPATPPATAAPATPPAPAAPAPLPAPAPAKLDEAYYKNHIKRLLEEDYGMPRTRFILPTTPATTEGPTIGPAPVKRADGGLVTGPGTSKSDSIPARLSNGEYVLSAEAVSQLGVDYLDKLNNVPKFADGGLVGSVNQVFQSRGLSNLISGVGKLSSFGERFSTLVDGLTSNSGLLGKFESLKNLNTGERINQGINGFLGKFTGGLTSNLGGGIKEKAMGFVSSKIPGLGSLLGGSGGIKEKAMGFVSSKIPGLGSLLGGGGLSGITSKIPGLSSISNVMSGFKEGGVGGAIKSLASGGIGKMLGGAIGTAIPIPGLGTMIGSVIGSKVGNLVGGLFGKKKPATVQPQQAPEMRQVNTPDPLMMMAQLLSQSSTQLAQQIKVDTAGIEQVLRRELHAFIVALNNIQINMDGASVGKVLVNASDAAATLGLFRKDAQATL
jgi:hypothetical protein